VSSLGPSEISARRRPGLIVVIALLRLALGLCLSFPLSSLVSASGIGLRAQGDRVLFEGGGYLLLELLRRQGDALTAALRGLLPLFGVGLLLGAAANVALLVALDVRERLTSHDWLVRAWARFPAQLVIAAGAGLSKVLLLVLTAGALDSMPSWPNAPIATSVAQLASLLPFVLLLCAVGGFEDVVKAALVRHDAPLEDGLARAARCLRRQPLVAAFGWLPYAALLALTGLAVARLVQALDVSQPGAWRVFAVFAAHQLVVALSVACRAGWYARALRLAATAS